MVNCFSMIFAEKNDFISLCHAILFFLPIDEARKMGGGVSY